MPEKCLVESIWQKKVNEPLASSFSAAPNRLPARTTTLVVPSPASMSCAADKSTNWYLSSVCRLERWRLRTIFAAGCNAWIFFRIVAPSFVTMTSPLEVEI